MAQAGMALPRGNAMAALSDRALARVFLEEPGGCRFPFTLSHADRSACLSVARPHVDLYLMNSSASCCVVGVSDIVDKRVPRPACNGALTQIV